MPDRSDSDPSSDSPDTPADRRASTRHDLRTAHLWHFQPVRDLLLVAIVAGTVYAGYAMRTVTIPLLIAVALAYLFEPVVVRLTASGRRSRPMAVGLILTILGLGVAIASAVVVPVAVGQTLAFSKNLKSGKYDGAIERVFNYLPEEYREDVRDWTNRVIHPASPPRSADTSASDAGVASTTSTGGDAAAAQAPTSQARGDEAGTAAETGAPQTEDSVTSARGTGSDGVGGEGDGSGAELASAPVAEGSAEPQVQMLREVQLDNPIVALLGAGTARIYSFAMLVFQLGLAAVLIPFYFYYFSVHWPSIMGFFGGLVPEERRDSLFSIFGEMDRAVAGFVRGRIVISFLMGVMFAVGWQVCGVPYGIALGLLTGALSIVPYLGGIGLPFAVGLLIADQMSIPTPDARMALWAMLLWPSVVFLVVQTIEGYVLTPVIAGKATNLDPVTIVVAILAGGSVAGIYGMLLAIPIAACGKIAAKRLLLPRIAAWAQGRASDPLPLDDD